MNDLRLKLTAGTKIKFGPKHCDQSLIDIWSNEIYELHNHEFTTHGCVGESIETIPAIFLDNEWTSIYSLFGNDLSQFMDCEIIGN